MKFCVCFITVSPLWWRRKWQPTPVLLPGKFHGWRSLVGYSPWGQKESDTTELLYFLSFYNSFWRRTWQPTQMFLPEESHRQRVLVGYGLWGCKESDMTKQLTHTHTHTYTHTHTHVHTNTPLWWQEPRKQQLCFVQHSPPST